MAPVAIMHLLCRAQIPCGQKMGTVGRTCSSWASEVTDAPDVGQRVASDFCDLAIAAAESGLRMKLWARDHAAS
jgi:hypothetical protein